ncbi:hypothetical protein AVDCRST_MAG81-2736 [uncultured Synechococcales cyanobacterium]|uniref:Uncharacterized protein n=1 Tax=uncultured Synechococcales cyanobacterium TaxID=1936017 RepID=A0A6J4VJZ2_9CYAN|nr:hypothetical protein AVDCRST_MAG81-2736 [uncultured Synechococcales cyanobacterium]
MHRVILGGLFGVRYQIEEDIDTSLGVVKSVLLQSGDFQRG